MSSSEANLIASANNGCIDSVLSLINLWTNDDIGEFYNYGHDYNEDKIISFCNKVSPYLQLLEANEEYGSVQYCLLHIYYMLRQNGFTSNDGISYEYKEYYIASQDGGRDWDCYIDTHKDMMKEFKEMKQKIAQFEKLQTMSTEDIIKSVIKEYM